MGWTAAIPAEGEFFLPRGRVDFPMPRELATEEIPPIVESFAQTTRNVRAAGFDGIDQLMPWHWAIEQVH